MITIKTKSYDETITGISLEEFVEMTGGKFSPNGWQVSFPTTTVEADDWTDSTPSINCHFASDEFLLVGTQTEDGEWAFYGERLVLGT